MSPTFWTVGPPPFIGPDAEGPPRPLPAEEETKWLRRPRDVLILLAQSDAVTADMHNLMVRFVIAFVRALELREPNARIQLVDYGSSAGNRGCMMPVSAAAEIERGLANQSSDGPVYLPSPLAMAAWLRENLLAPYQIVLLANDIGEHPRRTINAAAQLKREAVFDCVGIGTSASIDPQGVLAGVASTNADGSRRVLWSTVHNELLQHAQALAEPIDLRRRASGIFQPYPRSG